MSGKRYTFHSFLALNSIHIITEAPNFTSTFVLMLIVIFLSFVDWWCGWGVFSRCVYEAGFHMIGKRYTFDSFSVLNSTHIITEAPNFTSTFVSMLIIIFLNFIDWRRGWGVFSRCAYELFTCPVNCTHLIAFWLSILHTSSLKLQILQYLCFHANNHIPEFRWLATWLRPSKKILSRYCTSC